MKKLFMAITLVGMAMLSQSQTPAVKNEILYGAITKQNLQVAPYSQWFTANYEAYQPNIGLVQALKKINTKDITVQVFMGTWCGDSKREVPRFLKLVNELGWPENKVSIIAVGGSDSLYKQSPQGEEKDKSLFRVPLFIIYKNGVEINRINEFPVNSLERDLYAILNGNNYYPNYKSFGIIRNWLIDGTLTDKNISKQGLAMQLKSMINSESELNSIGYLLLKQGKKEEALRIFQMNANLYPESTNVISSLGEGYLRNGDKKNAVLFLERALELNKDPKMLKEILALLYEAKGGKE